MHTVTLTWSPSSSPDVVGYYLYSGTASGAYSGRVDAGNSTNIDVPNLIEGTNYFFTVTAYSADGNESAAAAEFHYLPNPPVLLNLSTRAMVQTGDNVLIAGFIVGGSGRKRMVVRALGPSLLFRGLNSALEDPELQVYGAEGLITSNDSWTNDDVATLTSLGLLPLFESEAAAVMTLSPGAYSVIVSGKGGTTGIALLEVYDVGVAE